MAQERAAGGSWRRAAAALLLAVTAIGEAGCAEPPRATASRPPRARASALPKTTPAAPAPATVSRAPGRLPSAAGGIPVVVRAVRAPATPAAPAARAPAPLRVDPAPRALAAATARSSDGAEQEIRAMLGAYLADWNRHDPAALAAHWSGSAESVDLVSGDVTHGRAAVEEVFDALFRADGAAAFDLDVESIRMVRHDVALVDAVSTIDAGGTASRSRLSAVVTREPAGWKIASVRETPLDAGAAPAAPSLDALDWLVGEWEDAGDGVTAHTRCFWSTGHAFLIRCHTVSYDAPAPRPAEAAQGIPGLLPAGRATDREVTEIIGWDPETASIRSWVFTSEGRFAEGTWARRGQRWLVAMEGRGADRGAVCTATLERIGTDELAYRCTGDTLADALPPACDFSRTGRDPAAP